MTDIDLKPIIGVAIQILPDVLAMLRAKHASEHPDAPALTDEQAQAALAAAVQSSIAKDDAWILAHPPF